MKVLEILLKLEIHKLKKLNIHNNVILGINLHYYLHLIFMLVKLMVT